GEEREGRFDPAGRAEGPAPPWVRAGEAHRVAIGEPAAVPRGVALSDALPPGTQGLGRRPVGRKSGRAPEALLPAHGARTEGAREPTPQLAGVRARAQSPDGVQPCLIGARISAGSCRL